MLHDSAVLRCRRLAGLCRCHERAANELAVAALDFETLATYVYQFAKDELLEEAALPALGIVFCGIIPVILMNAALNKLRI